MWLNAIPILAAIFLTYGFTKHFSSGMFGISNKKADALFNKDNDGRPTHVVCGIPAPDGVLFCRLELGHSGWHSHHGPVAWYMGNWAEDNYYDYRYGNAPW